MGAMNEGDLIGAFHKYLSEKSFLVVLTNLSSNEEWGQIKACFPNNKKGSRLIVCTEKVQVASLCVGEETETLEHKQLSSDPRFIAFYEKDSMEPRPSSSIDIIDNNGSTDEKKLTRMGTMLSAYKESQLIGRMDEKSEIVKLVLGNGSQESQVISIRGMGGLGKTTLVKHVFQSQELCNKFEKRACVTVKRPFDPNELINSLLRQLTVAGGDRGKSANQPLLLTHTLEGKKYLVVLDDLSSTAEWDAINHYFPRRETRSRIIVTTRVESIANHCSKKQKNIHKLKTLGEKDECNLFTEKSAVDLSRIRSLTVFGEWRSFYISKKMRLLRVLDLESTYGLVNHHLEHIGSLLHLKYISLRGCDGIYHLPDSWGNLLQLETLDIKGTRICTLPQTIIKLRKPQHLFGGDLGPICVYWDERIPHHMRELCLACCAPKYLKDVETMGGDPNRHDVCTFWWHVACPTLASRRLDPYGIVLPKGVWKLKSLHTLGVVNIAGGGKAIMRDIRRLTQLRKLAVGGISKKNCQEFYSTLAGLSRLESLSVTRTLSRDLRDLLDQVSPPPSNLQSIKLRGRLGKLPKWIGALQNLVKLKLGWTELSEADGTLQVLGKLPNLAILRLLDESFRDEVCRLTFRQEAPFPSLMVLELQFVCGFNDSLKSVEYEEGATPKLELLRFCGRSKLPDSLFSGLAALPKLKAFEQNTETFRFEANVQAQLAENPNRPIFRVIQ